MVWDMNLGSDSSDCEYLDAEPAQPNDALQVESGVPVVLLPAPIEAQDAESATGGSDTAAQCDTFGPRGKGVVSKEGIVASNDEKEESPEVATVPKARRPLAHEASTANEDELGMDEANQRGDDEANEGSRQTGSTLVGPPSQRTRGAASRRPSRAPRPTCAVTAIHDRRSTVTPQQTDAAGSAAGSLVAQQSDVASAARGVVVATHASPQSAPAGPRVDEEDVAVDELWLAPGTTSGYRGVSSIFKGKRTKKVRYRVEVEVRGVKYKLGTFLTALEAARRYAVYRRDGEAMVNTSRGRVRVPAPQPA